MTFVIFGSIFLFTNIFTLSAENNSVSVDVSNVWEVQIIKKSTNEMVKTRLVPTNSFFLDGLENNVEYFARIRTKNIVYSDWVTTGVFIFNSAMGIKSHIVNRLILSSDKGELVVFSDLAHELNIYNIDGRIVRCVNVSEGKTVINGLRSGFYIIDNQKVVVK